MKLNKLLATPIGLVLLALAIILDKYLPKSNLIDFLTGFFYGLSIVLTIYYIIVTIRKRKSTKNEFSRNRFQLNP
jgi:cytosine/uracil/thiamine/allantoin permease